ncbi:MAG: ATP-binding protein [Lachnospiraceae bacterium]|nr:ATP-binding protein [Lachnospiraceae bacterium]
MICSQELKSKPFASYDELMENLFACVNTGLDAYLSGMKLTFATGQGGYKNVLYPDLEVAHDICRDKMRAFSVKGENKADDSTEAESSESESKETALAEDDDLMSLLAGFAEKAPESEAVESKKKSENETDNLPEIMDYIMSRAEASVNAGIRMPFYELCNKQGFEPFTVFCFAAAVLSSTQTDYAGVFQVINENGSLSAPTIESAAKLFYGKEFSITGVYADMSVCLEQLLPVFDLRVASSMPFSTVVSPDKRIIDFLFGRNPDKIDENYIRFMRMLTDGKELDPILANSAVLEAMEISYDQGVKIFSYCGDEGSGRKFFVKHFCAKRGLKAIALNCRKLFVYDYSFVDKALWAAARECILTNSACVLEELSYREEEKEKFQGYMDLAFSKLSEKGVLVFTLSMDTLQLKTITKLDFTELTISTPSAAERAECWNYYSKPYELGEDCDLGEMTIKFLFTPGKIKDALYHARSLATMNKEKAISRAMLFKGCNAQMSSELSKKATRVEAKFGFDDIVMNPDQRETISHAIEQMNFKNAVYDDWNYIKKYPYGRGLTVLLFGAPGTGKSMMAQVLAHELNLELYRVDVSKVVDKYVGETEKSLSMIFREAKKCNVVLFFDECDTIFAKRSDDGGSNQASANNKTALLLQEMEAYDGVCVLATNYKHNIDPAFFRRMKYIVEFQFPDVDTREMLWRTTVPKTTPLAEDVDFRFLAERFEFAGGNIKNCILNAAFLAAADGDGKEVHMKHYLLAIKYEFIKVGKVFTKGDFEPYASQIGL